MKTKKKNRGTITIPVYLSLLKQLKQNIMKTYTKVAKHKADYISFLCPIASKKLNIIYGSGKIYDDEWEKFYNKINKVARYGGKNWKWQVEEVIINI